MYVVTCCSTFKVTRNPQVVINVNTSSHARLLSRHHRSSTVLVNGQVTLNCNVEHFANLLIELGIATFSSSFLPLISMVVWVIVINCHLAQFHAGAGPLLVHISNLSLYCSSLHCWGFVQKQSWCCLCCKCSLKRSDWLFLMKLVLICPFTWEYVLSSIVKLLKTETILYSSPGRVTSINVICASTISPIWKRTGDVSEYLCRYFKLV